MNRTHVGHYTHEEQIKWHIMQAKTRLGWAGEADDEHYAMKMLVDVFWYLRQAEAELAEWDAEEEPDASILYLI